MIYKDRKWHSKNKDWKLVAFGIEFAGRISRLFVMPDDADLPVSQFGFFDGR